MQALNWRVGTILVLVVLILALSLIASVWGVAPIPVKTVIKMVVSKIPLLQNLVGEVKPENDSIGLPAIKYLIDRAKFTHPDKSQAVFLIWDGHLITPAGQNALLKTLEESRPYEQFIITTHNHNLLLDTIISRCQIISLTKTAGKTIDKNILLTFGRSRQIITSS